MWGIASRRKVGTEDAHTEVKASRHIAIVGHLCDCSKKVFEDLRRVDPESFNTMWSLESIWTGNRPHVTLGLIYFDDIVRDDAKITWTAPEYGVEKFGLVLLRDVSNDTVMTDHTNGSDMIAKKAKLRPGWP
jgi:hypothetical protein